jgi:hypothetical protein
MEPKVSRKEQRHAYVHRRAYELAGTGQHRDYLTIEQALIAEGYPEARDLFDRNSIRDDLRQICARARKEQAKE